MGRLPKETLSRPRDQRRRDAKVVELVPDTEVRGPELPATYEWPVETLAWWQHWRESPMAQKFTDVDWDYLIDTAYLHANFWLGDLKLENAIRLRLSKFGATPVDRLRLHLTIGEPAGVAPKIRTATRSRRRLLAAVDGDKPAS